jgi:TPR repeat protein
MKGEKMQKTIFAAGLVVALILGQGAAIAADHPELTEADEAYSAENYQKAAALYRKDAELGVIVAQVNLAFLCLDGLGLPQDFKEAAKWFAKAAEQGNAEAQTNLAQLYLEGKGVAQNSVEAVKWFIVAGAFQSAAAAEKNMGKEQVAEARKLADDWTANFKKAKGR